MVTRLVWITDTHLNFLHPPKASEYYGAWLRDVTHAEAVVLTGDIAEANSLQRLLTALQEGFGGPVYWVFGNHDLYDGSFAEVRHTAAAMPGWLSASGGTIVPIAKDTALVGQDGWCDAKNGDPIASPVIMNDWFAIEDFQGMSREEIINSCRKIAAREAVAAKGTLDKALKTYSNVIFATHYPPFARAAWHEGQTSNGDYLPWFSSKIMGDTLIEVAQANPEKKILVLCGHTHSPGVYKPLPNLRVLTGRARYRHPDVAGIIDFNDKEWFETTIPLSGPYYGEGEDFTL